MVRIAKDAIRTVDTARKDSGEIAAPRAEANRFRIAKAAAAVFVGAIVPAIRDFTMFDDASAIRHRFADVAGWKCLLRGRGECREKRGCNTGNRRAFSCKTSLSVFHNFPFHWMSVLMMLMQCCLDRSNAEC